MDIEYLPSSLKYLNIPNKVALISLNDVSQRMWFSIIHNDAVDMLDITFPILCYPSFIRDDRYEIIGTETINGKIYDKLINPKFYQPRSNAKSARK